MEKRLKISLILSLIGIFILILTSVLIQPPIKTIQDISYKNLNEKIRIIGEIENIKEFPDNNFKIIKIKQDNQTISGVFFSSSLIEEIINKSENYTFTGTIEKYNTTLQINIEKIQHYVA